MNRQAPKPPDNDNYSRAEWRYSWPARTKRNTVLRESHIHGMVPQGRVLYWTDTNNQTLPVPPHIHPFTLNMALSSFLPIIPLWPWSHLIDLEPVLGLPLLVPSIILHISRPRLAFQASTFRGRKLVAGRSYLYFYLRVSGVACKECTRLPECEKWNGPHLFLMYFSATPGCMDCYQGEFQSPSYQSGFSVVRSSMVS